MSRSNRAEVRNPLVGLPSFKKIQRLPKPCKEVMRGLLLELKRGAAGRADKCWRTHKAPMAVYWKAVAVYAGHTARICK